MRFGRGSITELPIALNGGGRRVAVIGGSGDAAATVAAILRHAGFCVASFERHGEPKLDGLDDLVGEVSIHKPDVVIGVGGGSAIDSAKAVAGLIPNRHEKAEVFFERPGIPPAQLEHKPLPVVAVPTTAGTGSEATANAVVVVEGAKVSLRDARLIPRCAVVDADLGNDVPDHARIAAGFDAVVQLIEAYATPLGNPVTRSVAYGGAALAMEVLPHLIDGTATEDQRQDMATAATMGGVALANSKLGTVHGFAGIVGGRTGLAHGAICGSFAGPVLNRTIERLEEAGEGRADRYADLARLATTNDSASAKALPVWIEDLAAKAHLGRVHLPGDEHEQIANLVAGASSTKGNPVELSHADLLLIMKELQVEESHE